MWNEDYHFFFRGVLSQWCSTSFADKDRTYSSCEQYMMYQKAILFKDKMAANAIMKTQSPKKQKALGRRVKGFDPKTWNKHKLSIVTTGNTLRVFQDKTFRKSLLSTGEKKIVEASPYDAIWGIGFRADNAMANKELWGQNLLGVALTQVREDYWAYIRAAKLDAKIYSLISKTLAPVENEEPEYL